MRTALPFDIQYDFTQAAREYSLISHQGPEARSGMLAAYKTAQTGGLEDAAKQFAVAALAGEAKGAFNAHFHSGLCRLLCNQVVLAAAAFEKAAALEPDDFNLHLYSGIVDCSLGLIGRANRHWWAAHLMGDNQTTRAIVQRYLTSERHPERYALYPLCLGRGIDVGCGSDKVHPQAIGVDLNPRGQLGKAGRVEDCPSQADVAASGDELPLNSESLDYVVARHNLGHYHDPIQALIEWRRVLKPGGVLGIVLPDERFIDTLRLDPAHKHVFTPSSLQRIFDLINGFDLLYLDKLLFRWSFVCIAQKQPVPETQRFHYVRAVTAFEIDQVKAQARHYSEKGLAAMADQCEQYIRRLAQRTEQEIGLLGMCGAKNTQAAADKQIAPEPRSWSERLHLGLVQGDGYGWGVCSRYLIQELTRHRAVAVLSPDDGSSGHAPLPGVLFQALKNVDFDPMFPKAQAERNLGYTFFENELTKRSKENAKRFEKVLGGSTWCLERMREKGILNGEVLIQGIDPELFYPIDDPTDPDRFVIFSGGKFELRKGQDLVLRAVKIMQDKYPDVWLVNCWYNLWPASTRLMSFSPHIRFEHHDNERWTDTMLRTYESNGLDPGRIVTCELMPQGLQRDLYSRTDIGLFPNRCEGGTNLVLMEYMACGKPVIASNASGHKDIVHDENALLLNRLAPFNVLDNKGALIARWEEPALDEIVAHLEHAYFHRPEMAQLGRQAGLDLKQRTWAHSAQQLLQIIDRDNKKSQ